MMWLLYLLVGIVAAAFVGEGLTVVGLMFAADAVNHNPATIDLEDA